MSTEASVERAGPRRVAEAATFSIILALSFSHFLNDMMQSLVPALYPMLKDPYGLSFAQIGLITLAMQVDLLDAAAGGRAVCRSPAAALFAGGRDGRDLGRAAAARERRQLPLLLLAAAMVGVGSAVFHPGGLAGRAAWRRAGGTAWRNRCFRSAAMSARRSGRSSRRLS